MQYKTRRLEVKPISPSDEGAVIGLLTDDVVTETYMVPDFRSRADAGRLFMRLQELSQMEDRYVAGIYLGGNLIGIINETEVVGSQIEIGYAIVSGFHNHGYATEALTGAIDYLFSRGFEHVSAGAFVENVPSIRVMQKAGMTPLEKSEEIEYRGRKHRCVFYARRKQ